LFAPGSTRYSKFALSSLRESTLLAIKSVLFKSRIRKHPLYRYRIMARTRILLTGADSFMGSHVLAQLLSHDTVSVRAVVKSEDTAQVLHQHHQNDHATLDFCTVPEHGTTVPGIFDTALHDMSDSLNAVVHTLGVSFPDEADCLAQVIKTETESIIGFLESIQEISQAVSRVVIVASLMPFARWLGDFHADRASGRTVSEQSNYSVDDPEYTLAASQAGSNVVNDSVLAWTKQSGARFDVVLITAPCLLGPAVQPLENSSDLTDANRRIWNICSNEALDQATPSTYGIDQFADVRVRQSSGCETSTELTSRQDVADATIRALFVEKASNKHLFISAGVMPSKLQMAQLLIKRFPELRGCVRIDDSPPQRPQREPTPDFLDTYLISAILGLTELRSAEITLTETVRQMVDLQQRKAWRSVTQG
jgi:nucleoside-diphosphate-sugar epimerase